MKTNEPASGLLREIVRSDGGLDYYCHGEVPNFWLGYKSPVRRIINWNPGTDTIRLAGTFTTADLKAVLEHIERVERR